MNKILIYTDGACSGNPGPGGWAAVLLWNGIERGICGRKTYTTNNEMELTAVIQALSLLKDGQWEVEIHTDSKYVADSITKGWVFNWIKRGEINKRPNGDLWLQCVNLLSRVKHSIIWVKGHNGNKYNELCDKMAVEQRDLAAKGV